jgi:hypothetical protein
VLIIDQRFSFLRHNAALAERSFQGEGLIPTEDAQLNCGHFLPRVEAFISQTGYHPDKT